MSIEAFFTLLYDVAIILVILTFALGFLHLASKEGEEE
jgi:hypothetical protein